MGDLLFIVERMSYLSEEIDESIKNVVEARERLVATCKAYGQWLRINRMDRRRSLRGLAEEIGCSAPFLSDVERGNRRLCKLMRDHIDIIFKAE